MAGGGEVEVKVVTRRGVEGDRIGVLERRKSTDVGEGLAKEVVFMETIRGEARDGEVLINLGLVFEATP